MERGRQVRAVSGNCISFRSTLHMEELVSGLRIFTFMRLDGLDKGAGRVCLCGWITGRDALMQQLSFVTE